jgi:hypothetical protein
MIQLLLLIIFGKNLIDDVARCGAFDIFNGRDSFKCIDFWPKSGFSEYVCLV